MKNFKLITIILGLVAFVPIMPKGPEDVDINPPSQIDNQPLSGDDDDEDTERAFALESSNNGEDTKTVGTNRSTLNSSEPNILWLKPVESSASPESTVNITSGPASGLNDAQAMDGMLNRGQQGAPLDGSDGSELSIKQRFQRIAERTAENEQRVIRLELNGRILNGTIKDQAALEKAFQEPQNQGLSQEYKEYLLRKLPSHNDNNVTFLYESPQDLGLGDTGDVKKPTNDTYIRVDGVGEVGFDDNRMYDESPYIEVGDDEGDEDPAIFDANQKLTQRPAVTSGDQLSESANESVSGVGGGVRYSGFDESLGARYRVFNNGKEEFYDQKTGQWMSERDYRKKQRNKDWRSRLSYWKDIIVRKLKSLAEFPSRAKKELYRKIEDYAMKKVFEKSPEKRKQEEQMNITINRIRNIKNEIDRLRLLRDNPIDDKERESLDAEIKKANDSLWDVVRGNAPG